MVYNLKTSNGTTFDIVCSINKKPSTIQDLLNGLSDGSITWNEEHESAIVQEEKLDLEDWDSNEQLDTNYERRGPSPFYLNWIKFTG